MVPMTSAFSCIVCRNRRLEIIRISFMRAHIPHEMRTDAQTVAGRMHFGARGL